MKNLVQKQLVLVPDGNYGCCICYVGFTKLGFWDTSVGDDYAYFKYCNCNGNYQYYGVDTVFKKKQKKAVYHKDEEIRVILSAAVGFLSAPLSLAFFPVLSACYCVVKTF